LVKVLSKEEDSAMKIEDARTAEDLGIEGGAGFLWR
jgi:hypothetical protein